MFTGVQLIVIYLIYLFFLPSIYKFHRVMKIDLNLNQHKIAALFVFSFTVGFYLL